MQHNYVKPEVAWRSALGVCEPVAGAAVTETRHRVPLRPVGGFVVLVRFLFLKTVYNLSFI